MYKSQVSILSYFNSIVGMARERELLQGVKTREKTQLEERASGSAIPEALR